MKKDGCGGARVSLSRALFADLTAIGPGTPEPRLIFPAPQFNGHKVQSLPKSFREPTPTQIYLYITYLN